MTIGRITVGINKGRTPDGGFDSVPAIRGVGAPGPSRLTNVAHCLSQDGHLTLPLLGTHLCHIP